MTQTINCLFVLEFLCESDVFFGKMLHNFQTVLPEYQPLLLHIMDILVFSLKEPKRNVFSLR